MKHPDTQPRLGLRALMTLLAAVMLSATAWAQSQISVESFKYLENNSTATSKPMKNPRDNKNCALIIIRNVTPEGFKFDSNNIFSRQEEHTEADTHEKVIYMYVAEGAKKINLKHKDTSIKALTDYVFPTGALKSGRTYEMVLGKVFSGSATGSQYFEFNSKIPGLIISVEENPSENPGVYIPWEVKNGTASKSLKFGTYKYKARAKDYVEDFGTITVNDETASQQINLVPNFGLLTIPGTDDLRDAKIFIDDEPVGDSALKELRVGSGDHKLTITKPLFEPYSQTFTVKNGEPLTITPKMVSNARRITVKCPDAGAKIYLQEGGKNVLKGTGTWNGPMEPGSYLFIAKLDGCKDAMMQVDVKKLGVEAPDTFTLPVPQAMYGSINVTSNPTKATIWLDGQNMGETPKVLNNVIAKSHRLVLKKAGYNDYSTTVNVADGKTSDVNGSLTNICTVRIISNAYVVTANNSTVGKDGIVKVPRGTKLKIEGSRYNHKSASKTVIVNGDMTVTLNLARNLLHEKDFYFAGDFVMSGYMGAGVSMGFNANKFNMQLDWEMPFSNSHFAYYRFGGNDGNSNPLKGDEATMAFALKFGWNINIGTRFRLTPQVGFRGLMYNHYYNYGGSSDTTVDLQDWEYLKYNAWHDESDSEFSAAATIGLRMLLQTGYRFGISVTPEYKFAIGDKPGASYLYGKANCWNAGPSLRVGIVWNF